MRYLLLFSSFFALRLVAQQPTLQQAPVDRSRITLLHTPKDISSLDNILGLSREQLLPVLAHYEFANLVLTQEYPFVKEVIEIKNFQRWDYPAILYIFIDSTDHVCRLHYVIAYPDGISEDYAEKLTGKFAKEHHASKSLSDAKWEIASWEDDHTYAMLTWQKKLHRTRPSYLLSLKSYIQDHLMQQPKWPKDGIFTPVPQ